MSAWSDETRILASDKVLYQVLDGEAVLLDLGSGTYFGLNDVGTAVWSFLKPEEGDASPVRLAKILDQIVTHYDVEETQARQDLNELLDELLAKGLVLKVESAQ